MSDADKSRSDIELEKLRNEIRQLRSARYIPWLAMFLTVTTTLIGVWQFNRQLESQLRRDTEERTQDFRRAFLEARRAVYMETAKIVGTIAALPPENAARVQAEQAFRRLYRGDMVVVEDPEVKAAMIQFERCLSGISSDCQDATEKQRQLGNLSIRVATALRLSIGKVPETKLEDLYKDEQTPFSPP